MQETPTNVLYNTVDSLVKRPGWQRGEHLDARITLVHRHFAWESHRLFLLRHQTRLIGIACLRASNKLQPLLTVGDLRPVM